MSASEKLRQLISYFKPGDSQLLNSVPSAETVSVAHLNGCRVCISVKNANRAWPTGVKLGFVRENREPSVVLRSPEVDFRGAGRLFCWVPKGAISVQIMKADGSAFSSSDLHIDSIRRVSLLELGIRVGIKAPQKLLSVLGLLLSGNSKGESFRFARAVDELNALPYPQWLALHQETVPAPATIDPIQRVSVLVTVDEGTVAEVAKTLKSLADQNWKNWTKVDREALEGFRSTSGTGYLWLHLPAGCVIASNAIDQMVQPFASPDVAVVYTDEDNIDCLGRRHSPMLKPAWSPLLAQSGWLPLDGALIALSAVPRDVLISASSVNDVVTSIADCSSGTIVHIPRVLLTRSSPRIRRAYQKKPISSHSPSPKVSVIIPTRDRKHLLAECVEGLRQATLGVELDIIIVDNDSREPETLAYLHSLVESDIARVISMPGSFNFAHACNLAVSASRHEFVLLLNNDVTPIEQDWLVWMIQEMADPTVGAVGAYLLYPNGLVQHAGVTIGAGSIARHSFAFIHPNSGEDRGLLDERRDVSAVTGACLLTTKSLWQAVGGMDSENLAVAFNDVDYCLKLRRIKKRVIWTPYAKLWHHESVSRGKDDTVVKLQRFAREEATMHRRWGPWLLNDPFHSPNLSKVSEDFVLEAFPISLAPRTSTWDF